jgi:hypothetical protein
MLFQYDTSFSEHQSGEEESQWWGRVKGVVGQQQQQQQALLSQVARRWGRKVRHVTGSRLWDWSLVVASQEESAPLCRALEERQQAR